MNGDMFNSSGRCAYCSGIVSNVDGRRLTREQLAEIHRRSCPGVPAKRDAA